MASVDFWYEFASSYSYPAAMRVEALAAARSVAVHWRPFLLGPIFAKRGLADSPFNLDAAKGRYMWADLKRVCAALDLPFAQPQPFPQASLLAARVALALGGAHRAEFSKRVYRAEFAEGGSIAERAMLASILQAMNIDPEDILARAQSPANKEALKAETALAESLGIFGAPNLITSDGQLFWGNDRLEEGIAWEAGIRTR